ncbi:efflux RND transporter periplasmic adaptor subunit [Pseudomonas chlororaphis]|uniref:Efflux transporter periplasmic adaptor subunit n=1 Tax=Pseudomonas chlororaphis TaxID=587753 RepID=A0A1Q8EPQ8_9PSED|nr:efflux RND transporter periplasmic adaptor subunit [Pseudomonas chlororaphis]OLF53756.1 efflux transporter periplasmic adaptor subunit [Pseudomonas chlororaphis]
MKKTFKRWAGGSALLVAGSTLAIALAGSDSSAADADADATPPLPAIKVAVAPVVQGPMPNLLTGIGELEATRQVMVTAEASGLVTLIAFRPGETVRVGQTLVQLNDAPERGELARLQAQASNARSRLQRTRLLLPQQAATQEQLDEAQADFRQIQGDIARVTALIEQKRIKAPFSGVLGVRKINLGQFVQAGEPMVSLTDAQTLYANVNLPERSLAQLKPGQDMQLSVDAYPDRSFAGTVSTLEPRIDPGTRTLLVQATVPNAQHLLAPGMYVNAQVSLPTSAQVLSVPETAVSYNSYGDFVYAVQGDDPQALKARLVQVKTGQRSAGRVVLLDGVKASDRVVTSGQLRLSNGAHIEIIPWDNVALKAPLAPASNQ